MHALTQRAFAALERFTKIESVSGSVLIISALCAVIVANKNPTFYHNFLDARLSLQLAHLELHTNLHFLANEVLMTLFFFLIGTEIKGELVDGNLAGFRKALLPLCLAIGGVIAPAVLYVIYNKALNPSPVFWHGWAIPTATDIAFALGVLALLSKRIPTSIRVLLLSLAVIDDLIAVLIIAVFYSQGLSWDGVFPLLGGAVLMALCAPYIRRTLFYFLPLAMVWYGLFKTGIHPSLAGVVIGLMVPTSPLLPPSSLQSILESFLKSFTFSEAEDKKRGYKPLPSLKKLIKTQRASTAVHLHVIDTLHLWVAFFIMPLFAFCNAGINFSQLNLANSINFTLCASIAFALFLGKPLGVFSAAFLAEKLHLCARPSGVRWRDIMLVGVLAGIGFTMAIFITLLSFVQPEYIAAAQTGIILGSLSAAILALLLGRL